MIIFEADDPLVLDGTYDREGYKPGERARIEKAHVRRQLEEQLEAARLSDQIARQQQRTRKP